MIPEGYTLGRGGRLRPKSAVAKYRNIRTEADDPAGGRRVYASKAEAKFAEELNRAIREGEIRDWFPQVSIPYGVDEKGRSLRYVADAMVLHPDGAITFHDRKGRDTPASRAKRAALRQRGLNVRLA